LFIIFVQRYWKNTIYEFVCDGSEWHVVKENLLVILQQKRVAISKKDDLEALLGDQDQRQLFRSRGEG